MGSVLVQHPNAGVYSGTTSIDVTINNDTPMCKRSGGVTVTIDPSGETGLEKENVSLMLMVRIFLHLCFWAQSGKYNWELPLLICGSFNKVFHRGTVENGELNAIGRFSLRRMGRC